MSGGFPKENAITSGAIRRNRRQAALAREHQRHLDSLLPQPSIGDENSAQEEIDSYSDFDQSKVFRWEC